MVFIKNHYLLPVFFLVIEVFQSCISAKKYDNYNNEIEKKDKQIEELFLSNDRWRKASDSINMEYWVLARSLDDYKEQNEKLINRSNAPITYEAPVFPFKKSEEIFNNLYIIDSKTNNLDFSSFTASEMQNSLINVSGDLDRSKEGSISYLNFLDGGYDMAIEYINLTEPFDESQIKLKSNDCNFESLIRTELPNVKVKYISENEMWFYRFLKTTKDNYFGKWNLLEVFCINLSENLEVNCQIKYFESYEKRLGRVIKTNLHGEGLTNFINVINVCNE